MSFSAAVAVASPLIPARSGAALADRPAFWDLKRGSVERNPRAALQTLLQRVRQGPSMRLFDAVEQGVPTIIVSLLAAVFGSSAVSIMSLIGVSETTFRRKDEAGEPLPEVAGHRVMGLLRIVATLQRLLEESGDPERMASFDLAAWVGAWLRDPLAELDGKTPAEMLRNPEGLRAVEDLLERLRGGLPA